MTDMMTSLLSTDLDGHEHENEVHTVKATCEDGGMNITRCKICGHFEKAEYIEPAGHKNIKITKQPTCTENGERKGTCTECGKTVIEVIPALNHNWVDWKVDRDDNTREVRTCVNCGEKEYRELSKEAASAIASEEPTKPTAAKSTTPAADKQADGNNNTDVVEKPADNTLNTVIIISAAAAVLVAVIAVVIVVLVKKRRKNNMNLYR